MRSHQRTSPIIVNTPEVVMAALPNNGLLFIHGPKAPNDDDVAKIIAHYHVMGERLAEASMLIITDGGGPAARHRRDLETQFGPVIKHMRASVVTDAGSIHFILAAMSFFIKNIKSFSLAEIDKACSFSGFSSTDNANAFAALQYIGTEIPAGRFRAFDTLLKRR